MGPYVCQRDGARRNEATGSILHAVRATVLVRSDEDMESPVVRMRGAKVRRDVVLLITKNSEALERAKKGLRTATQ